ncbi:TMEM175 family protein [Streptomyces sp. GDS52]|uniref:TMEM175 family protein n=1 Tax=Streptomyces sp. GDS52 TaxID=3406419 RepID=UPI003FD0D30B
MRIPTPQGGPERLVTLADGVFAIAVTLLVLDLSVPQGLRSGEYREALRGLLPPWAPTGSACTCRPGSGATTARCSAPSGRWTDR